MRGSKSVAFAAVAGVVGGLALMLAPHAALAKGPPPFPTPSPVPPTHAAAWSHRPPNVPPSGPRAVSPTPTTPPPSSAGPEVGGVKFGRDPEVSPTVLGTKVTRPPGTRHGLSLPTLGAIAPQVLGVKLTKAVFTPAASTSHETVAVDEPRRGNGFAAAYWLIAVLAVASAGAWLARPQGTHRR